MDKIAFAHLTGYVAALAKEALTRMEVEHLDHLISTAHGTQPSASDVVELVNAMATDRKIEAIKAFRTLTGWGLKESKDAVERVMFRFANAS